MAKSDTLERWSPASSSAINRVVYNPALKRLAVEFKGGRRYTYDGVSRQRFEAIKRAPSAGRVINTMKQAVGKSVQKVSRSKGALRSALTRAKSSRASSATSNS
jgi:hypothetical protein